ncbi:MAG: nucleolar RNA-binding Nop10p family protein [Candidatus Woesearchaeota archaeon]
MHILKCPGCGKYTMKEKCDCGGVPVPPKPPKWSPDDKYASYRRQAKRKELEEKGLL